MLLVVPTQAIAKTSSLEITIEEPRTLESEIKKLSEKYQADANLVTRIIQCESKSNPNARGYNRTKEGIVWSTDYGPLQINNFYHQKKMQEMGLNIEAWGDSLEYGIALLAKEGTRHWKASQYCWN